jgi:hypothetical protein
VPLAQICASPSQTLLPYSALQTSTRPLSGCQLFEPAFLAIRYPADLQRRPIILMGLPDVPPDPILWVQAAVHSEAIRPEHPTPKLVTDNLDNFSNRGDNYRLSTPSTPQDKATPALSLAPVLPCRGYRGYRSYRLPKSHPCKWRRLDSLAGSSLTPRFLPIVKVVSSLDPLRLLYSLAPLLLALFSQRLLVASDGLHMLLRRA